MGGKWSVYLKDLKAEHCLPCFADLPALQDTAGEMTAAGRRREAVFKLARSRHCLGTLLWEWELLGSMVAYLLCIKYRWNSCWILGIFRYLCNWNILRTIKDFWVLLFLRSLRFGLWYFSQVALQVLSELMPCVTETNCPSSAVLAWEGDIAWRFSLLFLEGHPSLHTVFWTVDLQKHTGKANTFRNSGYSDISISTLQLHRVQRCHVTWVA